MVRTAALCGLVLAVAVLCAAGPQQTFVVAAPSPDDLIARRAIAELRVVGVEAAFEVRGDAPGTIEALGARHNAPAVLAVCPGGESCVDLWARAQGRPEFRERLHADAGESREGLAVRAVEVLRAACLDVTPAAVRAPLPPPPAPPTLAPQGPLAAPDLGLRPFAVAIVSVVGSPRGLVPGLSLGAQGGVRVARQFEAVAHVSAPIARGLLRGPEGSARAAPTIFGAGLAFPIAETARLRFAGEVGLAALMLSSSGVVAEKAYLSRTDHGWAALPYVRPRLRYVVRSGWSAYGGALLGVATPRFEIKLGDRTVATWGRPVIGVELGADWAWRDGP